MNNQPKLIRVQLDISDDAKRNLRIISAAAGLSMSEALDLLLTEHISEIAKERFGVAITAGGEE
jgi:antitoxin component of RelBE/YafQ-DinJ toxin-antitoxin module